jgi:hypothetical protein
LRLRQVLSPRALKIERDNGSATGSITWRSRDIYSEKIFMTSFVQPRAECKSVAARARINADSRI